VFLMVVSLLDDAEIFFACFQDAIDALVADDETLVEMLQWAERKAAAVATEHHMPVAVRSVYVFFALDLTRDLDLALDLDLARALARALDLDLDLALDLDRARARALDRDLDLDLALARDIALARDLALALARARALAHTPGLALDVMLYYAYVMAQVFEIAGSVDEVQEQAPEYTAYIQDVVTFARNNDANALADALTQLSVPAKGETKDEWRAFNTALQSLMQQHRDIGHQWNLSYQQQKRLADYLEASNFLLECLNLATVSDRAAIEGRLLLPPRGANAQPA
jgi:hypothetical protein